MKSFYYLVLLLPLQQRISFFGFDILELSVRLIYFLKVVAIFTNHSVRLAPQLLCVLNKITSINRFWIHIREIFKWNNFQLGKLEDCVHARVPLILGYGT